jgi:hypothetical protein
MRRRRLLRALSAGLVATAAGCLASPPDGQPGTAATPSESGPATPTAAEPSSTPAPTTVDGVELPVPRSEMRQPLPRDYIPAIVEPAFAESWGGLDAGGRDPTLPDDAPVLGVERAGRARAYPLRILDHHEVVNDDHGGPIAVTYCVLCGSGVVFERQVTGEPTTFGVSGKLWRSDLVMYDDLTDSLWSQLMATAIGGPRTGDRLAVLPSTLTTWSEWQTTHSGVEVLLPPPHSTAIPEYDRSFDYFSPKYGYGDESQLVGRDSHDGDLHPKTMVVGLESGGTARAYPFPVMTAEGIVNDRVGGRPVVVAVAHDDTLVAYDRRIDGETLGFESDGDRYLAGGGSRWNRATGVAMDGPFAGQKLRRANNHPPMFWNGWSKFNPETDVYGLDRSTG